MNNNENLYNIEGNHFLLVLIVYHRVSFKVHFGFDEFKNKKKVFQTQSLLWRKIFGKLGGNKMSEEVNFMDFAEKEKKNFLLGKTFTAGFRETYSKYF